MVEYNIISTGSKGNAVVVDDRVLIDCGVPFKSIQPHLKYLQLVLLTHIHSDHFRHSTIRRMARERPMLRFGCCPWMVAPLVDAGVSKSNIDLMTFGVMIRYRASITVEPGTVITRCSKLRLQNRASGRKSVLRHRHGKPQWDFSPKL